MLSLSYSINVQDLVYQSSFLLKVLLCSSSLAGKLQYDLPP